MAAAVYRTILRKKKLFLQAPTGVGKTISTLFPSVKAIGEGLGEKIFYLTAKTITKNCCGTGVSDTGRTRSADESDYAYCERKDM